MTMAVRKEWWPWCSAARPTPPRAPRWPPRWAHLLRSRHGLDVKVVPTPPHSLPQTSSGKLSRSKAKALYVSGAFLPAATSLTA